MRSASLILLFSSVLVACSGDDGATGAQGPVGAPGKDGIGSQGPKGDPGTTGQAGVAGPKGDTGEAGPKGDTGAKGDTGNPATVRTASGSDVVASLDTTPVAPAGCQTSAYLAGANESALVQSDVSVAPSAASTEVVSLAIGVGTGGGALAPNSQPAFESLGGGAASLGVQAIVPLTAGTSYVFGPLVSSSGAVTLSRSSCTGTVVIVKTAP